MDRNAPGRNEVKGVYVDVQEGSPDRYVPPVLSLRSPSRLDDSPSKRRSTPLSGRVYFTICKATITRDQDVRSETLPDGTENRKPTVLERGPSLERRPSKRFTAVARPGLLGRRLRTRQKVHSSRCFGGGYSATGGRRACRSPNEVRRVHSLERDPEPGKRRAGTPYRLPRDPNLSVGPQATTGTTGSRAGSCQDSESRRRHFLCYGWRDPRRYLVPQPPLTDRSTDSTSSRT